MAGIIKKVIRPYSPDHPDLHVMVPIEEIWRYEHNKDHPGPQKPGWYHVVNQRPIGLDLAWKKTRCDVYSRWLFRNGHWYDGETRNFIGHPMAYSKPWPEFWSETDVMDDTSGDDIDIFGITTLLCAVVTDWAKEYRKALKTNNWSEIRNLERDLKQPGVLNTCLMDADPETVLAHHRKHKNEQI